MTNNTERNTSNPVLEVSRIYFGDDEWGTTMGWWFAIADYLTDQGAEIPEEWEFRQSPFGSDTETIEYQELVEIEASIEDALFAGRVFAKYAGYLKSIGADY